MTVSHELITRMLTYEIAWHVEADMPGVVGMHVKTTLK